MMMGGSGFFFGMFWALNWNHLKISFWFISGTKLGLIQWDQLILI
jgi:hypothetical protein